MSSVDVIIPCYRYGHFLHQCVHSVLTQSFHNVRVIIIDDASPDNTAELATDLARSDSRVTFLRHRANKGHIITYNEGIDWASADYLLLLSADDYLLPGALKRAAALMDTHPNVGFTFGNKWEVQDGEIAIPPGDLPGKPVWRIIPGLEFIKLSGARNIVSTPTAVVRTELQKRLGGYRPELPHSGDMEMWLRLAAHAPVGNLESYQAVYRLHEGNMSLAYAARGWIPDLQQRKAALDCFFEGYGNALPNPEKLRRQCYLSLAGCAVAFASMAFNRGEMEICDHLAAFAASVCPEVKRSLPWLKLTCKERMGFRSWRMFQPGITRIRNLTNWTTPKDRVGYRTPEVNITDSGVGVQNGSPGQLR